MKKSFGTWLKERRISLDMRQDDLARLAGTTKQNISRLEKGKPTPKTGAIPLPSQDMFDSLAEALGVPVIEIMRAAGLLSEDEQREVGAVRILGYYRELPDEAKSYLEVIAEALWRKSRQDKKRDKAA